ncbi:MULTISPECIES: YbhB/YbcL family Raf kinase inhibitor-like protein [unclassified Rhizobium]|uniref:YbhB/YbcL family Raf kinase inhibitor-like protein n=1 Tax=unclassified Rhizobium TaxID=2613769 RepID=UPI001C82A693|nr:MULTISPECIES: YbhB/YbcL family Raf kinase inhibitor-like protein [unclassified Rhizobium]MBX5156225.1 YbhB/YbcL family Raf kinase inhibitor-like protein [Rhizobium sp. NZLR8]MBX5165774.1 YbhB/YbcL family Raf kinase inhibitor-like protein [Rhizobium sp. NZLR4b]MBX5191702.1 YbhB/YbcL family Raf kinase inhibitor-like protein [Rhizobium sp. NZLR3b]MBX5196915.1 YbhB/YbcL family Raf kinase inhibitor-like protein [Rhizobium sp. NZLR10]MBX5209199.1 YbhB/YbcL family Raf kinase inhibitor-like protein
MRSIIAVLLAASVFGAAAAHAEMKLTSKDLTSGKSMADAQVFNSFGCAGKNISPELAWSDAPPATKSFAVMAYDPDAPTGSGWWHWSVFNIPADASEIATGASGDKKLPAGAVEGHTDFGVSGYGGACPPAGDTPHHYQFTVYALSVDKLPLPDTAPGAMVGFYVRANTLDKASVEVTYGR